MTYRNPVRAVTATIAGGSAVTPTIRVRDSLTVSSSGSSAFPTLPPTLVAGDLLLAVVSHNINYRPSTPSGWTYVGTYGSTDNNTFAVSVWKRTAIAANAGATVQWSAQSDNFTLTIFDLVGATTWTALASRTASTSSSAGTSVTIPTGDLPAGTFLLGGATGTWGWASAAQGGPPSAPAWSPLGNAAISTFTAAAPSYNALVSTNFAGVLSAVLGVVT